MKKGIIEKIFVIGFIIVISVGLLSQMQSKKWAIVYAVFALLGMLGCVIFFEKKQVLIGALAGLIVLGLIYDIRYLVPTIQSYDATRDGVSAGIPVTRFGTNNEMWIPAMVADKNVNLYYTDDWLHYYFELYAGTTSHEAWDESTDKETLIQMIGSRYSDKLQSIDGCLFDGYRKICKAEDLPKECTIYFNISELEAAETLWPISDENGDIYFLSEGEINELLEE